jgi:hypothetical protein
MDTENSASSLGEVGALDDDFAYDKFFVWIVLTKSISLYNRMIEVLPRTE